MKPDRPALKNPANAIMNASNKPTARRALRRLADSFEQPSPAGVACLRNYFDEPLPASDTSARQAQGRPDHQRHRATVPKRSKADQPIGAFQDITSMECIVFAVFT